MAIVTEDAKSLTAAQGIGQKDRPADHFGIEGQNGEGDRLRTGFLRRKGARRSPPCLPVRPPRLPRALAVLGYSTQEVQMALKGVDVENLPLEEIIRQSLRKW